MTIDEAMAVQAVIGPSWDELLIVRGSGRVRTEGAKFRRPTRIAAADAVQPSEGDRLVATSKLIVLFGKP